MENELKKEKLIKLINNQKIIDDKYIKYAKALYSISNYDVSFQSKNIEETIKEVSSILFYIDKLYSKLFNQMLDEDNCNNPYIMILNSNAKVEENESMCTKNDVFFYKTNTTADPYFLLHEFTHYLINRKESFRKNKENNEVASILSEFLIAGVNYDNTFMKNRLNNTISNAKTLLCKNEILNGNLNLKELYTKYNLSQKEIKILEYELFNMETIDANIEIPYINGFIYALKLREGDIIENYKNLVEELTISRNKNYIVPCFDTLIDEYLETLKIKNRAKKLKKVKNVL